MDRDTVRDMGGGLVLRRPAPNDTERLLAFQETVHHSADDAGIGPRVGAWCRDLLDRPHPTLTPGDFTLVEDTAKGTIVSSLCIIPQTWRYGNVEFGVGRPELVGTLPGYRNRGLVRAQMEEVHRRSSARGDMVQAITGIPFFYRQFGYEMALELSAGRWGVVAGMPELATPDAGAYVVRPAGAGDVPFLANVIESGSKRWLVSGVRDKRILRYELGEQSVNNLMRMCLGVIVEPTGRRVGCVAYGACISNGDQVVAAYEVGDDDDWWRVTPCVIGFLRSLGDRPGAADDSAPPARLVLSLGSEHPSYATVKSCLPHADPGCAWYMRVPDVPAFLGKIAPVLEGRLRQSAMAGYTGDLKLSFYRSGARIGFASGRITSTDVWAPSREDEGTAAFPNLTFLQLLFGFRSLAELRHAFPDCCVPGDGDRGALVEALFPKQPSHVWPLS